MNANEFSRYKRACIGRFEKFLSLNEHGRFDKQGLPAYTNPNFLMRWLFWQRIRKTIQYVEEISLLNCVLDFGCGLGVMLPYLNSKGKLILALDVDTSLAKEIGGNERWGNVMFTENLPSLINKYEGRIDLILALDVLEHVVDLDGVLLAFKSLLSPSGRVLVSGPTENLLYKLGRKLAGYSGEYHKTDIFQILRNMKRLFVVKRIATILPPLPFFIIAVGEIQ